jgi:hypothetical protein
MTLATLTNQGAQALGKDALQTQIAGRTLYTHTLSGNTEWTNFSSGRVTGQIHESLNDNMGWYGLGTWHISDDGKYCVDIAWQKYPDAHWCRAVYQVGSRLYIPEQESGDTVLMSFTTVP